MALTNNLAPNCNEKDAMHFRNDFNGWLIKPFEVVKRPRENMSP
jgi:hypothetical protein